MKICFSTLGCPKLSFREVLSLAKDLGYDGIEVRGLLHVMDAPDIREFSKNNIEETKKRLKELGLEIPVLASACYVNLPGRWKETFEMAARYVDTAALIGAKYVRLLGDITVRPTTPVDDGIVADHTAQIAAYAAEKGVDILLETNGVYADSSRLRNVIEHTNKPNVGVLWDINHTWRIFSEPLEQTYANIGHLLRHVHLKDSVMHNGEILYRIIGYGDLPIRQAIPLLMRNGYQGYYSLEWVKRWDMSLEEPGIAFAAFQYYMRNFKED